MLCLLGGLPSQSLHSVLFCCCSGVSVFLVMPTASLAYFIILCLLQQVVAATVQVQVP